MKAKGINLKNLLLLHLVMLFYSMGSLCSKFASISPFMSLSFIVYYGAVLIILFAYAIVWQQILKRMPLTVAYANKAVVILWGMIWGAVFFGEKITFNKFLGAAVIITGIYLVVTSDGL